MRELRWVFSLLLLVVSADLFLMLLVWMASGKLSTNAGVSMGLVGGAALATVLAGLNYLGYRRQGARVTEMWRVHQTRRFILPLAYEHAWAACERSIVAVWRCRVVLSDRSSGMLVARKRATLTTWGDEIEFHLRPVSDAETEVELSSRPVVRGTLVDYGSSLANVVGITERLGVTDADVLLRPSSAPAENVLLRPAGAAPLEADPDRLLRPAADPNPEVARPEAEELTQPSRSE